MTRKPLMFVTVLSLGPLAVRAAGDAVRGWREAALVGGGAGLVAAMVTYLLSAVLATVMVLGVVSLIVPLSDPASLTGVRVDDVLRPVVQQAVT